VLVKNSAQISTYTVVYNSVSRHPLNADRFPVLSVRSLAHPTDSTTRKTPRKRQNPTSRATAQRIYTRDASKSGYGNIISLSAMWGERAGGKAGTGKATFSV
jgi:hypothetical protein